MPAAVCNAAVEDFMRDRHLRAHRGKMKQARTVINDSWTRREEEKLVTSRRNAKREQVEADRRDDIKRENVRLLLRMQAIGEGKVPTVGPAQPPPAPTRSVSVPEVRKGSNSAVRMQELRRIDAENRKLLQRLHKAKPSVNVSRLEEEHRQKQKVMHMRCEFFQGEQLGAGRRPPRVRYWDAQEDQRNSVGDAEDVEDDLGAGVAQSSYSCARLPPIGGTASPSTGNLVGRGLREEAEHRSDEAAAVEATDAQGGSHAASPSGIMVDDGFNPESEKYGFVIPKASRRLAEKLLEAEDIERQAEADAAAAKEAAERAFRDATALDSAGGGAMDAPTDLLSYDNVIRRCQERMDRGAPTSSALEARAAVAAANGRALHVH